MSEEMKARLIQFLAQVKPYFQWDIDGNDDCIEGASDYRKSVELLEELEFLTKELTLTPYEIYMQTPFAGEREYD